LCDWTEQFIPESLHFFLSVFVDTLEFCITTIDVSLNVGFGRITQCACAGLKFLLQVLDFPLFLLEVCLFRLNGGVEFVG